MWRRQCTKRSGAGAHAWLYKTTRALHQRSSNTRHTEIGTTLWRGNAEPHLAPPDAGTAPSCGGAATAFSSPCCFACCDGSGETGRAGRRPLASQRMAGRLVTLASVSMLLWRAAHAASIVLLPLPVRSPALSGTSRACGGRSALHEGRALHPALGHALAVQRQRTSMRSHALQGRQHTAGQRWARIWTQRTVSYDARALCASVFRTMAESWTAPVVCCRARSFHLVLRLGTHFAGLLL